MRKRIALSLAVATMVILVTGFTILHGWDVFNETEGRSEMPHLNTPDAPAEEKTFISGLLARIDEFAAKEPLVSKPYNPQEDPYYDSLPAFDELEAPQLGLGLEIYFGKEVDLCTYVDNDDIQEFARSATLSGTAINEDTLKALAWGLIPFIQDELENIEQEKNESLLSYGTYYIPKRVYKKISENDIYAENVIYVSYVPFSWYEEVTKEQQKAKERGEIISVYDGPAITVALSELDGHIIFVKPWGRPFLFPVRIVPLNKDN